MTVFVTFALVFAGLSGVHSLNTVDHISMEEGATVQIPCQYEEIYKNYVKYLCRGSTWGSCRYEICSDKSNSEKYSIEDNKVQRIVTFTIKNLKLTDSDYYWCNIERQGRDDGKQFQLSVTSKGESELSVDSQSILGYFDDQITINCKYKAYGIKEWCRVDGSCVRSFGVINGAQVSLNKSVPGVLAVTMIGLKAQNIGWYWCGVGNLQMPVFLQLTERPTTTTIATTTPMSTAKPTTVFPTNNTKTTSVSDFITAPAVALGLLIIIVIVSLVAWFQLKRKVKKTEVQSSTSPESSDCPVYSNVTPRPRSQQNTSTPQNMEVLYSSVSFINKQASKKGSDQEEDVLYSTLAQH